MISVIRQTSEGPSDKLGEAMVCEHALKFYRDGLAHRGHFSLENRVLAGRDLVSRLETQGLLAR